MITEIISIGTELLLGDIIDSNANFIAQELTAVGFDIHYISTTGDNFRRMKEVLKIASERSDILITTGGLGPTDDDLTREAISEVSKKKLILNRDNKLEIENYFKDKNYRMVKSNYKQAYFPEGSEALSNNRGTAPGIWLDDGKNIYISLPGVPEEMKYMFKNEVLTRLKNIQDKNIKSKILHLFGIGESDLENKIHDLLIKQSNPTFALLAGRGEVNIRITASGKNMDEINEDINNAEEELSSRIGKYIYGTDNDDFPRVIGNLLEKKEMSISVAESCTGGLLGSRFTSIPGSSYYFKGGVIAYSNKVKEEVLSVNSKILRKYGAVSEETAIAMARGVKKLLKTDLGISITGIAGPGGGTVSKSVGLVYIALSTSNDSYVYKLKLGGGRDWNQWMSSQYAFNYILNYLNQREEKK